MKLCLKEQAGAFLADGGCGGEVPWGESGLGNAQHRDHLSCVERALGAEVRGGEPGGREEAAMMRRLLWGEGARPCGNSTAWRQARESVEWTGRSEAEEPEVCWRSGCVSVQVRGWQAALWKARRLNILEPVGPTRTLVTTQLLFVRSGQLSTVHKWMDRAVFSYMWGAEV